MDNMVLVSDKKRNFISANCCCTKSVNIHLNVVEYSLLSGWEFHRAFCLYLYYTIASI